MMDSKVDSDESWMLLALAEAKQAFEENEVPVGAVMVLDGEVLARDHNRSIQNSDPTAHAEILVIRKSAAILRNYRLTDAELYVTVEPCPMCAGSLIWARVKRLVFGAWDPKGGGVESVTRLLQPGLFNHSPQVTGGICAASCRSLLQDFFALRR